MKFGLILASLAAIVSTQSAEALNSRDLAKQAKIQTFNEFKKDKDAYDLILRKDGHIGAIPARDDPSKPLSRDHPHLLVQKNIEEPFILQTPTYNAPLLFLGHHVEGGILFFVTEKGELHCYRDTDLAELSPNKEKLEILPEIKVAFVQFNPHEEYYVVKLSEEGKTIEEFADGLALTATIPEKALPREFESA